ncbi:piggyBac transposable element-derived protein 4-like [Diabrotica virgifera virgifera]|uniref:PiggyBac transposable element-derived protein domain-containing protein n=1 Tax=Diabrotica virgifera virgifera TaxID=50390 RepID=A0ABM5KQI8_DIAVI|nr:piggyBac transposable element-derived protein 4-like [Diabrotica virgifera virgifera]
MLIMSHRRALTENELRELANASESDESISETENHTSSESEEDSSDDSVIPLYVQHPVEPSVAVPSKDGNIQWSLDPPNQGGRFSASNVINNTPGVTRYACARIFDIQNSFDVLFSDIVANQIISMTNLEGQRVFGTDWKDLDKIVFQAYLGLLLLAGVFKSHGESTKSLWNEETGRSIFRATMSLEVFTKISQVIRFDNKATRQDRRRCDKLAAIREIWEKWVENLPKFFNPDENVTIDEQLVAFRGRCPFKQYIPSKPAKYGIKIWVLCDSNTSYAIKLQIYTGKEAGAAPERNQGMRVVCDLSSDLKGQNITCDNFFTSYNLGQFLLKRKITMLGTIRKNKPELPTQIVNKEVHSSSFYFTQDTTVVNYIPKKNKNVVLMSTLHRGKAISDRNDKKPQIILDYNSTKGAVDTLDQLVGTYTCKRKTNRWPMIVFYNMLDISAYNAFILWTSINPQWNTNKLTKRRIFLEELGKTLVKPLILSRKNLPRTRDSQELVKRTRAETSRQDGNSSEPSIDNPTTPAKRARCKFCSKSDNKTNILCFICHKHICKNHSFYYCPSCKLN